MIILTAVLLLFAFLIKIGEHGESLAKAKADVLKALFPFVIIMGHVSFAYPDSLIRGMRFAGPYVVGVFFFLSGYGLECKRVTGGGQREFARRVKRLLQPLVLPVTVYLLVGYRLCDDLKCVVATNLRAMALVLPYTWFVVVIAVLYAVYHLFRNKFKNDKYFDVFLVTATIVLSAVFFIQKMDGTVYVSNLAFAMGVIYKQEEPKLLCQTSGWVYLLSVAIVTATSIAYAKGQSPFHGFAMLAVPLYVAGFMLLYRRVGICNNAVIRFLKGISYEIYLWQSVSMLIVAYLKINDVWLHAGVVIMLSVLLAFVAQQTMNKIENKLKIDV